MSSKPEAGPSRNEEETASEGDPPMLFERCSRIALLAACVVVLMAAMAFLLVAYPSGDDFCRAAVASDIHADISGEKNAMIPAEHGAFAYLKRQYMEWSGRWAGPGLAIALMSELDPTRFYWILLTLVAGCHVVAVYVFFRTLLDKNLTLKTVRLATVVFLVLFWAAMPSPGQGIYWLTGGIENLLSVSLMLILFAGLIASGQLRQNMFWGRWVSILFLVPLAIFIPGIHELFGLILCLILAVGMLIAFRVHHRNRWLWLLILSTAVVGLLLVVLAPGNHLRSLRSHAILGNHNLKYTLRLAGTQGLKCATDWVLDPKLLCASLLFVVHPAVRSLRPGWLKWTQIRWTWVFPSLWLAVLPIPFISKVWLTGDVMFGRTLNGTYAIFILGWFVNLFAFTRWVGESGELSTNLGKRLASGILLLFAVSLVCTGNTRIAIADFVKHRVLPWQHATRERDRQIRLAVGQGVTILTVRPLPECPHILFENDYTEDPNGWRNKCLSIFYGLKSFQKERLPSPP